MSNQNIRSNSRCCPINPPTQQQPGVLDDRRGCGSEGVPGFRGLSYWFNHSHFELSSTEIRPLFQSTYVSGANRSSLFPPISPLHGSSRSHSSSTFRLQLSAFGWSFKKSGLGNTGKQRTPQDILVTIRSHKKMRNKLYGYLE